MKSSGNLKIFKWFQGELSGNIGTKSVNVTMKGLPWSVSFYKKWIFPLRIFPVNVTKSALSWGYGHIYSSNPLWKTSFFCAVCTTPKDSRLHLYTLAHTCMFWAAASPTPKDSRLHLYTLVHTCMFWAAASPTLEAYVIFFANQSLHNHLTHNSCNAFP